MNQLSKSVQFNHKIVDNAAYLSKDREIELARIMRSNDKRQAERAREVLVSSHMRLAKAFAYKRIRFIASASYDLEDLIQEATIGLCMAADRFDPDKGFRFATYARHWIKVSIETYILMNNLTIRLPSTLKVKKVLYHYFTVKKQIFGSTTSYVSETQLLEMISEKLGVTYQFLKPLARLLELDPVCLDTSIKHGSMESKLDFLVDESPSSEDVLDYTLELERQIEAINKTVSKFKAREREIYQKRIICHVDDRVTLGVLAEKYNVSRERIRQIEQKIREKVAATVLKNTKIRAIK